MKKFLLSFAALACVLLSDAQLILNEVYVRPNPNPGHHEYFELKNTTAVPQNSDCYTVVTYFENSNGEQGFYVVDLPSLVVAGNGLLVGSSVTPTFLYQNGNGTSDFSWNDGNISRYVLQSGVLTLNNAGAPYGNIFVKSNGSFTSGGGVYAVFLFNGSTLVDCLLGSHNSITVPSFITAMGTLTGAGSGCASLTYDFSTINNENDSLFGHVNPEAGTDNGYHRAGRGCEGHGVWEKSSAPSEHTPGAANPGNGNGNPGDIIEAELQCINNTTIGYNITGGSNSAFPVLVSLYYDANGSQFLDAGDVFLSSQTDVSVSDPAKTFTHPDGQEDFIFVFDGQGSCFDTIMPLNCPGSIVLPVGYRSFSVQRQGNSVSLRWETVTESNNRGFNIMRMQGNGRWETIGFVGTQAAGGNSNSALVYNFSDANTYDGITQYRLQQVDLDGRGHFSDIRTVKGNRSAGHALVYPNPSTGTARIAFDNTNGTHDVSIADMSGRTVKQWKNVTDGVLQINSLAPGVYIIRIIDQTAGTQSTERLVVSGR